MYNNLILQLKKILSHPLVRGLDIDSPEATSVHRRIIQEKPFLKAIYTAWYSEILNSLPETAMGPVVEIGSGGGFLKEFMPNLITSEILPGLGVDVLLDGGCLPFKENSLRGIVMVDVFHHLPKASSFLKDAVDCIKPGGAIVMLEPWNTRWSRFVYRYLHHEPFDPKAKKWDLAKGGPLSQSNQALPWIVFYRDRDRFEKKFNEFRIEKIKLHTPFIYILSGGVSFISFMPGYLFKMCQRIEKLFNPWIDLLAMFMLAIVVKKK